MNENTHQPAYQQPQAQETLPLPQQTQTKVPRLTNKKENIQRQITECEKLIDTCICRWNYTSGVVTGLVSHIQNNEGISQLLEQMEEGTDELAKMVDAFRQLIRMTC